MSSKYVFPRALKELRFHFSQTGEASAPLKTFLSRAYPVIKKHNPSTPVLIREAAGVRPTLYARFEFGREAKLSLEGVPEEQIEGAIQKLVANE
ncbi:uncharacterized protein SAPINGB_P003186 [Magnusiomyces paraingens]|uniref:Ribosomal protein/NADH dehydrogenase domain-containing protein n=1 Tax=Magnusiomyces paraingens TaxID=2606893 RepID=A0A5E8BMH6_9ASCO|nr:uncharacterized protein SAPINGB_P003186 [Saprochaete ingens]VVT51707.1 unnamed protein product [Saprochaete ingens]